MLKYFTQTKFEKIVQDIVLQASWYCPWNFGNCYIFVGIFDMTHESVVSQKNRYMLKMNNTITGKKCEICSK